MAPETLQALVAAIELKDLSTAAHTWRVVLYTRALAEQAGESPDTIRRLTHAAALHDIGKLDVPSAVLTKPGSLSGAERSAVQAHAALGHDLLVRLEEKDPIVLSLVRHHHERWDGQGYPDGLAGERIHPAARIFSVIDSFDAMTSVRPYRSDVGLGAAERALAELRAGAGTRYAPEAVDAFIRAYGTGRLGWILEYFNDRAELPRYSAAREEPLGRAAQPQPTVVVDRARTAGAGLFGA